MIYEHFALAQANANLADTYRILVKIKEEPLIESANKKILSAMEDLEKVSEAIAQQLEERR